MRRRDREITDRNEILSILDEAVVCRIALRAGKAPYIVPLNFGYAWAERLELFFHGANEGRKRRLIEQCNVVGFEIDITSEFDRTGDPCDWGMKFKSIVGTGTIELIQDPAEKEKALDAIMKHYGYAGKPTYRAGVFNRTATYRLAVEELTAKKRR